MQNSGLPIPCISIKSHDLRFPRASLLAKYITRDYLHLHWSLRRFLPCSQLMVKIAAQPKESEKPPYAYMHIPSQERSIMGRFLLPSCTSFRLGKGFLPC
ncbi:hypothetical protein CDAR_502111 [Caerostris darwini]|uniref:Uncharacterized protein n=1 Tax=Caerostris darwini TaxID=1538125 RepID=A0AAV4VXD4_9ARAC|nr:hypothetical protein CDAR_502111 [Caerostris darwini]